MSPQANNRLLLWLPIVLSIAITSVGWIANGAVAMERLNKIDERYEREVVPRRELDARRESQQEQLDRMEKRIGQLQETLDEILQNLPKRR
jgi:Tfp pilus assembly protein PilO